MPPTLTPQDFVASWCSTKLQKHALTNLYDERPTWLALAHRTLDHAVLDAYGWPHDLSDDEILARLLALNLERAATHSGATMPPADALKEAAAPSP